MRHRKPEPAANTQVRWTIPVISRRTFSSQQQRRCVKMHAFLFMHKSPAFTKTGDLMRIEEICYQACLCYFS